MKEILNPIAAIHEDARAEIKKQFLGRQLKRKGHTLFEVDWDNMTILPATYHDTKTLGDKKLVVHTKKNCTYVQALNAKNVERKIIKTLQAIEAAKAKAKEATKN